MNKIKNSVIYRFFFVGFLSILSICLFLLPFGLNKTNYLTLSSSFESNGLLLDETTQTEYQFTGSALQFQISYFKSNYQPGSAGSTTRNYTYQSVTHFPMIVSFDLESATKTLSWHSNCFGLYSVSSSATYISSSLNDSVVMVTDTTTNFNVGRLRQSTVTLGYVRASYYLPNAFNFDVRGVTISSIISVDSNDNVNCYCINYLDSNGSELQIRIYTLGDTDSFMPSSRTYWFTQGQNLTDNNFYNQGYNDGQNAGQASGYTSGYSTGYSAGYTSGELSGYNQGIEAGSDVSFLALIGATIDAPIKAFTGLFDFDISMGGSTFNIKSFLLAILTVAIVIAFVRIILAK